MQIFAKTFKGITPEDAISSVAEDMREWAPQKKLNNQKFGDAEIIRLIKNIELTSQP